MKSFTTVVFATLFAIAVNAMPAVDTIERRSSSHSEEPSQCNTGPVQCCNSFTTADDKTASTIINSLNLDVAKDVAVGLTCSPINIIGIGSNSCSSQPVCCSDNNFNGVIAIGCSPININLENSISGRTLL